MKTLGRKVMWGASGVLALAGVLALTSWPFKHGSLSVPSAASSAAPSSASASSAWPAGETREFSAELDSRVTAQSQPLVDVSLKGSWRLTRVGVNDGGNGLRLAAQLTLSELHLTTSRETEGRLRKALAESLILEISDRGLITGIGFEGGELPDAAYALSRGLLRALAASLQVARPARSDQTTWDAREVDFSGTYEAVYERRGPRSVVKTKRSYAECPSCSAARSDTSILRSRIDLEFLGASPMPFALSGVTFDEATRVDGGTPMPQMSSATRLRLRLVSTEASNAQVYAALEALANKLKLQALDNRGLDKRALLGEAKLAGTTFPGLAEEIARLDRSGQRSSGLRARAFSQLSAHLRYDPAAVADALRRIRSGDGLKDTLIDALGSAGSDGAQAALREILSDRDAVEHDRQGALLALSFTPKPSAGTTELLARLQDDPALGRQARYGLGTAAYRLGADDPGQVRAIVAALESRLADATSPQETMEYLRALGNAANPAALGAIARYLEHSNSSVRAAAVNALRRIPGASVDRYLAAALSDPSDEVRLTAASSIGYRERSGTLVNALKVSLSTEPERSVRLQVARVAIKWAGNEPTLRELLSRIAESDPDKKIRQLAASASHT